MTKKDKKERRLLRERNEMLNEIASGDPFSVVAYRHKLGVEKLSSLMNEYEPYIEWVNERRQNPELLESEARGLIEEGRTVKYIEEHFCLSPVEADRLVKKIQRVYGGTGYRIPGQRDIYVSDVERFKKAINIGDVLVCGVSPEGLLVLCKIKEKYKHFAATDAGGFEWNWLCVKNKERIPR